MTKLFEIAPSQLSEFLQRMKEWGFPTNTRLSQSTVRIRHGRNREIVVTSSAGTFYLHPDKDGGGRDGPNTNIIAVKWEQFQSIMEWIKDRDDFETDNDGNVTVLRLSHFPVNDDDDDDDEDNDDDDNNQFRQLQLASLCRFFGGLNDQRLKVLDVSRLTGLCSLRRTEVIRLSNLTEMILPGHQMSALVPENSKSSTFKMIDHHPILGKWKFDTSKSEFQHRSGPSCAVITKEKDSSIWESLSSLDVCLASPNSNADIIGGLNNLTTLHVCCANHYTSLPESWNQLNKLRTLDISSSVLKRLPPTVIAAWSETEQNLTIRIHRGEVDVREELNKVFSSWRLLEYVSVLHVPEPDDLDDDEEEEEEDYVERMARRFPPLWSRNWNPPHLQVLVLSGIKVSFQDLPSSTLESLYLHNVELHPPSARAALTLEYPKLKKLVLDPFLPSPEFKVMVGLGTKIQTPALEKLFIGETCCPPCAFPVRDFLGLSNAERNQPKLEEFATSEDLQISTTNRRKIARLLALNRCQKKSGLDLTMSGPVIEDQGNDDWFGNEHNTPISLWPHAIANSRRLFRPGQWPSEPSVCCCTKNDKLDRMEKEFKEEDGVYLLLKLYFEMSRQRSISNAKKTKQFDDDDEKQKLHDQIESKQSRCHAMSQQPAEKDNNIEKLKKALRESQSKEIGK